MKKYKTCPKCRGNLVLLIDSKHGLKFYGHTYSFEYAFSNNPMCTYSERIN